MEIGERPLLASASLEVDPRRELLLDLFRIALAAVDGRRRVRAALAGREGEAPAVPLGFSGSSCEH